MAHEQQKAMKNKYLGGTLLVIGTSIGGGMLALPITTASLGFTNTLVLLLVGWTLMTSSALLLLEVNLWFPKDSHLITMAAATLGPVGKIAVWVIYLLLLYALLSAYLTGGADVLQHILATMGGQLSRISALLLLTAGLGALVCCGIHTVDYVNRGLMLVKLTVLALLIGGLVPSVTYTQPLFRVSHIPSQLGTSTMVILTSFGFAVMVPSLRAYCDESPWLVRKSILLGSIIPLISYSLWEFVIRGIIPEKGSISLASLAQSAQPTSQLLATLSYFVHQPILRWLAKTFTSVCLATSFLGVALSLCDFLSDALKTQPRIIPSRFFACLLTLLPPLLVAGYYPQAFIAALSYAGILCILLLVILPNLMAWRGRYHLNYAGRYQVIGGKYLLVSLLSLALLLLLFSGYQ